MDNKRFETILIERQGEQGEVLVVILNRPEVMNAFNTRMMGELEALFREKSADSSLRAVVLAGAGGRAFCTGADLKERQEMSDEAWRAQHRLLERMFLEVKNFPVPVIAAVEGYALAGGLELALMADFIVASETARFGLTELRRGILPGGGGLQSLPRAIGVRRAKELVYTGRLLDAQEALAWGLVNRVVPAGQALEAALGVVREIVKSAPIPVRLAKVAISRGSEVDFDTGYALDLAAYEAIIGTEDRREGVAAFNEKRQPQWRNR